MLSFGSKQFKITMTDAHCLGKCFSRYAALLISVLIVCFPACSNVTTFETCLYLNQTVHTCACSMDEAELSSYRISERKWQCPVTSCNQILSRKQTLQNHLLSLHQIKAGNPPKRYKLYETDPSIAVPKSTNYAQAKKERSSEDKKGVLVDEASSSQNEDDEDERVLVEEVSLISQNEDDGAKFCCQPREEDQLNLPDCASQTGIHDVEDNSDVDNELDMELETESENEDADKETTCSSDDDDDFNSVDSDSCADRSDSVVDPPLYVIKHEKELYSSNITKSQHVLSVSAFASRHNLSDTATKDLLQLIQLHLPTCNTGETKLNELKDQSGFDKDYLKHHFYCDVCKKLFSVDTDQCKTPGCKGSKFESRKFFLTSDLRKQIQEILQHKELWKSVQENKETSPTQNIFDVRGSAGYKELQKPGGFLHGTTNLTLSLFTDGVPLFKSSGISIWPVYLLINEIPPKLRFLRKNMLMWGIWQGCGKPKMNMFLRPLVLDLIDIYNNGIQLVVENKVTCVKAMLVLVTMDLQARAYFTNMTQHNGEYGCVFCLEPGKVVPSGKAHCRIYPYKDQPAPLRTEVSVRECAKEAAQTGKRVQGFFGESVFSYLPYFSLTRNMTVDYMHGTLLGITKKLLELWFDSKHKEKPHFIGHDVSAIDKILLKITPPYLIHRLPRAIANNFNHWKASELRNWLLFYSLPCLQNILPDTYLLHFSCLVEATYILLGEGITAADLDRADILIKGFVSNINLLYGQHCMSLNVHNLLHLTGIVRQWGPLWAFSCFPFESFNGELKRSIHGTGNVCRQIFWIFQAQKRISQSAENMKGGNAKDFIDRMVVGPEKSRAGIDAKQCKVIQLTRIAPLSDDVAKELKMKVNYSDENELMEASKLVRNGFLMYSTNSTKVRKHNSYTIAIEGKKGVAVEASRYIMHTKSGRVFAVGRMLTSAGGVLKRRVPHLFQMTYSEKIEVVPAELLQEPLMVINRGKDIFGAYLPNHFERD